MKYISGLVTVLDGDVQYVKYPIRVKSQVGYAGLSDGCTVDIRKLDEKTTLGVAVMPLESFVAAVCLTEKTAMLHQYIEFVSMTFGQPKEMHSYDCCVMSAGSSFGFVNKSSSGLIINTTNTAIKVAGFKGSVVTWSDRLRDSPKVMSLYDLLGEVCRETRLDVMKYEELRFVSELRGVTCIIRFKKSVEAKRYFTKMYLDVMRA